MYDLSDLKLFEPITNEDISNGNVTINGLNGKKCLFIIDNEDGTSIKHEVTTVNDFNGFLDNDYKLDHIECSNDGIYIYLLKNGISEKIEFDELSLYLKDNVSCILEDNVAGVSSDIVDSNNNIDINEDTDKAKAEDDIDIIDEDCDLKPVIATDMSEVIDFNNANKREPLINEEPDFIEVDKIDFSKITVVLGKTDRIASSTIVDKVQKSLEDLGIKVYISDIDKIIGEVYEQAAKDNPDDDILGIRIGGESGEEAYPVIIENVADAKYPNSGSRNSSALALTLHKTLSTKNDVLVVSGRRNVYLDDGVRIETEFEKKVDDLNLANPGIKNVTILLGDIQNYDEVSNNIVEGIIYYVSLDREARDKPYFTLAGDPNVKPGSLQFGSDAAAYFDSDTVLVLPFPKELSMELKY